MFSVSLPYMWIMHCHLVARHYICELYNAILLQRHYICELCNAMMFRQASYMWIISCHPFLYFSLLFWQCLYIQLLFLCISHLNWWWRNLEWKQGLQSRLCYLTKRISRWLRIAPQRRIQRQMTSPIPPSRGACSNLAGFCCSYRAYGILHCYVICLV